MTAIHDFVEDWIEIRGKLQRQLKRLEADKSDVPALGAATGSAIVRIRRWIDELNELLKECAAADKT